MYLTSPDAMEMDLDIKRTPKWGLSNLTNEDFLYEGYPKPYSTSTAPKYQATTRSSRLGCRGVMHPPVTSQNDVETNSAPTISRKLLTSGTFSPLPAKTSVADPSNRKILEYPLITREIVTKQYVLKTNSPTTERCAVKNNALFMRKSLFFHLPRELRDQIYHHAFEGTSIQFKPDANLAEHQGFRSTEDKGAIVVVTYGHTQQSHTQQFPPWLFLNKQVQNEALELFYHHAKFSLNSSNIDEDLITHLQPTSYWNGYFWASFNTPYLPFIPNLLYAQNIVVYSEAVDPTIILPMLKSSVRLLCSSCKMIASDRGELSVLQYLKKRKWAPKKLELIISPRYLSANATQDIILKQPTRACYWYCLLQALPSTLRKLHIEVKVDTDSSKSCKDWKLFEKRLRKMAGVTLGLESLSSRTLSTRY